MKTVFKGQSLLTGITLVACGAAALVFVPSFAQAQEAASSPTTMSPMAQEIAAHKAAKSAKPTFGDPGRPDSKQLKPSIQSPAMTSPIDMPPAAAAAAPLPVPATPATAQASTGLKSAETDAPEGVKNVIKRLDSSADDVTVEDLNGARQAIAKVEVLIELEKKLAELQKARSERDGGRSMAGAIPASALGGPGGAVPQGGSVVPLDAAPASLDIQRIVGGAGHYRVLTKSYDGSIKSLEVGDKMADGSFISSITATGVTLDNKGDKRVVRIKNVDKVFSGTP